MKSAGWVCVWEKKTDRSWPKLNREKEKKSMHFPLFMQKESRVYNNKHASQFLNSVFFSAVVAGHIQILLFLSFKSFKFLQALVFYAYSLTHSLQIQSNQKTNRKITNFAIEKKKQIRSKSKCTCSSRGPINQNQWNWAVSQCVLSCFWLLSTSTTRKKKWWNDIGNYRYCGPNWNEWLAIKRLILTSEQGNSIALNLWYLNRPLKK